METRIIIINSNPSNIFEFMLVLKWLSIRSHGDGASFSNNPLETEVENPSATNCEVTVKQQPVYSELGVQDDSDFIVFVSVDVRCL